MKSSKISFSQVLSLLALLALGTSTFVPYLSFLGVICAWFSALLANRQYMRILALLSFLPAIPYLVCDGPALPLVALWGTMAWVPARVNTFFFALISTWGITAGLPLPAIYNVMPLAFPLAALISFSLFAVRDIKLPVFIASKITKENTIY